MDSIEHRMTVVGQPCDGVFYACVSPVPVSREYELYG